MHINDPSEIDQADEPHLNQFRNVVLAVFPGRIQRCSAILYTENTHQQALKTGKRRKIGKDENVSQNCVRRHRPKPIETYDSKSAQKNSNFVTHKTKTLIACV